MIVWRRIGRMVVAGALLIAAGLVVARCWSLRRPADNPKHPQLAGMCDFQDVVYFPTRAAFAGVNPYDARSALAGGGYLARYPVGNEFSPYAPLLFVISAPLAALPLVPAEVIFSALNLGLLGCYAYVLLRIGGYRPQVLTVVGIAAFLLLSRPGQANHYYGQTTLLLVLATLGAWWHAESRCALSAGCLAVTLIKPTFGGPLVILMALRGFGRAVALGLTLAVVANVAVIGALLPGHFFGAGAVERLLENQAATDADPAVDPLSSASRIDLPFVLERWSGRPWPAVARYGMTLAILGITGWQLRIYGQQQRLLATGIAALTVTICIYHNIYDALMVGIPGIAAWRLATTAEEPAERGMAWCALCLLLVPAVQYLSSNQFLTLAGQLHPALAEIRSKPTLWTMICTLNGTALAGAWLLLLVLLRRARETEADARQLAR